MSSSTISSKIKNSLEILTKMYGITEADLCRGTKISQPTLWRLLNGGTDPRASTLNAIAKYFNISIDQLIGNQPIIKKETYLERNETNLPQKIPVFSLNKPDELTMIGKAGIKNWSKWIEVESSIFSSCFAAEVSGESMWPDFTEGTLIIIDPSITPKNRNYVLCKLYVTKEIIFREYVEDRDEKLLKPINFAYKTIQMNNNDEIIGVVIQSKNMFV